MNENIHITIDRRVLTVLKASPVPLSANEIGDEVARKFPGTNKHSAASIVGLMYTKRKMVSRYYDADAAIFRYFIPDVHKLSAPSEVMTTKILKNPPRMYISTSNHAAAAIQALGVSRGHENGAVIYSLAEHFMRIRPYTNPLFPFVKVAHPLRMGAVFQPHKLWMEETRILDTKNGLTKGPVLLDMNRPSERSATVPLQSTIFWNTAIFFGLVNSTSKDEKLLPEVAAFARYAEENYVYHGEGIHTIYQKEVYNRMNLGVGETEAIACGGTSCDPKTMLAFDLAEDKNYSLPLSARISKTTHQMVRFQCDFIVPENVANIITELANQILDQWTVPDR